MKPNMGSGDRLVRLVVAAILASLYFFNVVSGTLAVVFLIVAVVFALTSVISFCPLYTLLGINTGKKKA